VVSVLVATYQGAQVIGQCLRSLAAQTLAPSSFEIVVVHNGPADGTDEVVEEFRRAHPDHSVRLLELRRSGAGHARNIAIDAARGDYVTFVDDDDEVSPRFLAAMVEAAEPDVVVATLVADVTADAPPGTPPDEDTYVGRGLARRAGRTVPGHRLSTPFSYNAAKLVATDAARSARYDSTLRSGEDHVYWLDLFARHRFRIRVLDRSEEAVYLRTVRPGRVGRQDAGYDFNVTQRLECLAAIERIDRSPPEVAHLARALARGQATWINEYLRSHPDERDRVVSDVLALGLQDFPWAVVNHGLARDLAVCYAFPPAQDTSGIVAAKRLRERGVVTDVISKDLSRLRNIDPGAHTVTGDVLGRTHVVPGPASFTGWRTVPEFAAEAWRTVEAWERLQGPYRTVYSRAMAVASHFAAALVKVRRPAILWTAEFSDPLKINAEGVERVGDVPEDWLSAELRTAMLAAGHEPGDPLRAFDWAERLTYALADRIVFTNHHQLELMLGYCDDARLVERVRSIAEVRHHPVLPPEFYALGSTTFDGAPDRVHLAYFGVFYATRDLGDVVAGLGLLRQDERESLRLHVFTDKPDRLRLQVARAGLVGTVRVRPYVPVLEFLHLTTQFDVLVVNDAMTSAHHARNPYLPSKLADYAGSGTPVWAICEDGSALSTAGHDYTSRLGDPEAAAAVLRRLVADKHSCRLVHRREPAVTGETGRAGHPAEPRPG
jgi:glycosyltransferase involved in cell wall biosynthesis